jgi:hypothetical protein
LGNEATDSCDPGCACSVNGDCDDGLYCNGAETWQVTASNRDAWSDGSSCDLGEAYFGDSYWGDAGAYQFAVTIPQGATIVSATLELYSGTHSGETRAYTAGIRVENVDNAAAFTCSSGNDIHGRSYWSTTVDWLIPSDGLPSGQYSSSPDITSLIQQIVNRSGWSSGNYLNLKFNRYIRVVILIFRQYWPE